MALYAVLNGGQIVQRREIADWGNYPAHKKAANDEKGDGHPVLRPIVDPGAPSYNPNTHTLAKGQTITADAVTITYTLTERPAGDIQAYKRSLIDVERERRLQKFVFDGVEYDFDEVSRARIDKARVSAMVALEADPNTSGYRWADENVDFGWITAANGFTQMDVNTTLAFGTAAAAWEGMLVLAARNLKNMDPIPEDYDNDQYWP
jgi:hypothetical protein